MAMQPRIKIRALAAVGAAALAVTTLVALAPSGSAAPNASAPAPVRAGSVYLALGDSVPFGYREAQSTPTPDYTNASKLVGYPTLIADDLDLHVVNAACPGETTTSMINTSRPDHGCNASATGGPGYRTAGFPLHVKYTGSQLNFAMKFLKSHPNTKLVTLQIGANDGLVCQETTADHCASQQELGAVLAGIGKHVATILHRLRSTGYKGQLVIMNYYSINSASNDATANSLAVNATIANAAKPYNVTIADAFNLFLRASRNAPHKDTCAAGLLTILQGADTPCGIHPSYAGQAVLATAAERVISKS
ncbi:MAG TPA: SGNH/GDSL hydrolase family protein [Jatrophihabitantaceae bacterium]|jgi:lysophospholipase L1-like esterase|nr:SGNH/GDSL hydrolase family protein [Jatrophihabitantaceae bacterium]